MNGRWLTLGLACVTIGCGTASVRDLSQAERVYLDAVSKRVDAHAVAVEELVNKLRDIDRKYAQEERKQTHTAVAEAKLLESMRAPWTTPSPSLQTTQRAVILFHLYELLAQERAAFEAEQAERDARRQKVVDDYERIGNLLHHVIENQKVVLEYANRPAGSQIAAIADETLKQADAFNGALAKSTDPRLQALAEETTKASERVEKTKSAIQAALDMMNGGKK